MSKSLQTSVLVFEFLVVSLAASDATDSKTVSMVKELQQQAKKQDRVVELLKTHLARQEKAISALQDKVQRQDKRLLQQEHQITALWEHGQRQDKRLLQQEHLITTLREHKQRQDERLLQQEHLITGLWEHGQRQDKRLLQQEHLITTLREHKQRQDERLLQREHLITAPSKKVQTQKEFNDNLHEQERRQSKTHNKIYNPLQFHEQWKNQKQHTSKEESTRKNASNSPSNTEPLSDRLRELPVNRTKAKKAVLPPKPVERKVPMPELAVRAADGPIAFQAKISGDINHLGLNQKILFDQVLLNLGSAYSDVHGLFTAPRSGLYIFAMSLKASNRKDIEAQIIKNGELIAGAIAQDTVQNNQGSVTVVSKLNPGDEVWVANTWPADTGVSAKGYSSFMGCLVVEI